MEGNRRAPSYSNPIAVAAFWCGLVAAVVPAAAVAVRLCLGDHWARLDVLLLTPCLGVVLGPYAAALALLGLRHARQHPTAGGMRWAVGGLVLGLLTTTAYLLLMTPIFNNAW